MLVSFLTLAIAIATLSLSRILADEITRMVTILTGRFCLFLSLVYAPWLIKLLIVVMILLVPVCTQRYNLRQSRCSPLCLARPTCHLNSNS